MGHGEGCDRLHDPTSAPDEQEQAEHEQQVVHTPKDMFHAESEERPGARALRLPVQNEGRRIRTQQPGHHPPVGEGHPYQNVHHRG